MHQVSTNGTRLPQRGERPSPTWGIGAREFYALLERKPIELTTLDGRVYRVRLVGVDQYDLIGESSNKALILFPKNAVKCVKLHTASEVVPCP